MAKITMSELLEFRQNVGTFLEQKLPLPVAYKLNKINNATEKEVEFYHEKFQEIVTKYARRDEEGNVIFSDDNTQILIQEDKIPECNDAMEELLGLQVEINTYNLKIEDFGENIECTASEIDAISPFLED